MGPGSRVWINKTNAGQFAMSHGSYDSNLGSKILILAGDIRSRSWHNIGDSDKNGPYVPIIFIRGQKFEYAT